MKEELTYHYFYSGPLVFKTKIKDKDLKAMYKLCNKKKDVSKTLAGIVSGEYKIDSIQYQKIMQKYLNLFELAYFDWYQDKLSNKIKVKSSWVNYMKPGDCNPTHVHTNCNFSSVLFIKIPKNLNQEISQCKGNKSMPGGLTFDLHSAMEYHIFSKTFEPHIGDFYMFPYNVKHSVNSFKSKGERISIAANFL
jgi:uncharacterized protein (TIGR02466 family)|tara:strand:- start:1320 stop:1898 length:579 start_codon:yes stop_codon:yes gene_type:complete